MDGHASEQIRLVNNWAGVRWSQIEIQAEHFCKWGCWGKKTFVSWDWLQTCRQEAAELVVCYCEHHHCHHMQSSIKMDAAWSHQDNGFHVSWRSGGGVGGWGMGGGGFLLFPLFSSCAVEAQVRRRQSSTRCKSQLELRGQKPRGSKVRGNHGNAHRLILYRLVPVLAFLRR